MAKWSESEIYQQTRGTNRFTRFVGWLNNLMNPNHSWVSDWQQFSRDVSPSEDIINQVTKQALTGAEREANAFSAQQAQEQRDWEERMSNTAYQRQVADMRAAGVNPALMMNGGSSGASTPSGSAASSVSPTGNGVSMSELMQMYLLPLQKKAAEANIESTRAGVEETKARTEREREETKLTRAKTENMSLVNAYYPSVTESQLDETLSRIGVNWSTVNRNEVENALTNVKKLIADKENEYADKFYKFRAEYEEAHTKEAKESAAERAAQALLTGYENEYAREHGAKLSSSSILALCSAIGQYLGLDNEGVQDGLSGAVGDIVDDSMKPFGMYLHLGKKGVDKFRRWRYRGMPYGNSR